MTGIVDFVWVSNLPCTSLIFMIWLINHIISHLI
jgi:hypothetical protein